MLSGLSPTGPLLDALWFAAQKHRDQRRKGSDGSPYINHPIHVAQLLATTGGIDDVEVLMAALLHDTIEDTATTSEELEQRFGSTVSGVVEEVSDDAKRFNKAERKRLQIEGAPNLTRRAKLVRLADKICNVHDIGHTPPVDWTEARRAEYFDWAERVVAGLRGTNAALEEGLFDEELESSRRTLVVARPSIAGEA